jgi:NAD(P)-dependent dehydrogenase (short-subunit alcohol dehydrogenase family)
MATLVVGAKGGIGLATVERLKKAGHEIVELNRRDGVDVLDPNSVRTYLAKQPPIDKLVHLPGTVGKGGIEDHTIDDWRRIMDDSVTTAFVVCQAVIPSMKAAGGGAMVLMSSINGRTGGNRLSGPAYATAKAAMFGLTHHMANDLAPHHIRVNCVAPGPVPSPQLDRLTQAEMDALLLKIPLRRMTPALEIGGAIQFLLSDDAASITGVILDINGGQWMG